MRSETQLIESIDRFKESFWERKPADRPPVGVVRRDVYMPGLYRRSFAARKALQPDDVDSNLAATDYEFGFARRKVSCDDFIAFNSAWRGVPWLEACCGCSVRVAEGSLAPEAFVGSLEQLAELPIPAHNCWLLRMEEQTRQLLKTAPADCWISPTILRGCSDVIAAMRGQVEFFMDIMNNPQQMHQAAGRINRLLIDVLDRHYAMVPPKLDGYGHIFGYWAPGKTIVIQEDAMCICDPQIYREVFLNYNADIVSHLGDYVLFHMHSIGYQHYRDVLRIPGLAGIQMTIDPNGPEISDMLPVFQEILEQSRLILWAKQGCQGLTDVLRKLPKEGLYVIVPDEDISSDSAFKEFIDTCWGS